jgi:hypothetical protein
MRTFRGSSNEGGKSELDLRVFAAWLEVVVSSVDLLLVASNLSPPLRRSFGDREDWI